MGVIGQKLNFQANDKFSLPNCVGRSCERKNFYFHQKKGVKKIWFDSWRGSYSTLFPPHCPAISRHLPENSILGHLPPFAHPHGLPHVIFSFFSDGISWVEYSFTYFKQEIGNMFMFFSFFSLFLPIFRKNIFWPIYPHLMPPMDHPTSAVA